MARVRVLTISDLSRQGAIDTLIWHVNQRPRGPLGGLDLSTAAAWLRREYPDLRPFVRAEALQRASRAVRLGDRFTRDRSAGVPTVGQVPVVANRTDRPGRDRGRFTYRTVVTLTTPTGQEVHTTVFVQLDSCCPITAVEAEARRQAGERYQEARRSPYYTVLGITIPGAVQVVSITRDH